MVNNIFSWAGLGHINRNSSKLHRMRRLVSLGNNPPLHFHQVKICRLIPDVKGIGKRKPFYPTRHMYLP